MYQALDSFSPTGRGRCIYSSLHLSLFYLSWWFSRAQHQSCYSHLDKDKPLHSCIAYPFGLAVKRLHRLGQAGVESSLHHLMSGKLLSVSEPLFLFLKKQKSMSIYKLKPSMRNTQHCDSPHDFHICDTHIWQTQNISKEGFPSIVLRWVWLSSSERVVESAPIRMTRKQEKKQGITS